MSEYHTPVLLHESVSALITDNQGTYVDATFGGGGHTSGILSRLSPEGRVVAFDRDSDAIGNRIDDRRLTLVRTDFRYIRNQIMLDAWKAGKDPAEAKVDGIQNGKTELQLSYYRVWISGIFYRMYESELAGAEPVFEVMMIIVLRKSINRPLPSVRRPSSSTWRSMLKTFWWAFSISSSRTTEYGWRLTRSVSCPPSSYPTYPGGAPTRRDVLKLSLYSLMSTRMSESLDPNTSTAICWAR